MLLVQVAILGTNWKPDLDRCGIAGSHWIDVDQIAVAVPHPTRSSDGISRFTRRVSHGFWKTRKISKAYTNMIMIIMIMIMIIIIIYIYQHRQRGPTVFLEVDIFKGSHYGNPYSQGHTNC